MERVRLFGFDFIAAVDHDPVLNYLNHRKPDSGKLPFLITPNVDQLVKYHRSENQELLRTMRQAELVLPDGQPIIWASRWKSGTASLPARLTGSDLFPLLWKQLKEEGKKVFFILPEASMGEDLSKEYERCRFYAPPLFDLENDEEYIKVKEACLSILREQEPDHVMIGLGFPKQERLALDLYHDAIGKDSFYSLLGASFEFYLGRKKRAPQWMQRTGLEFVHRMFSEPGRMIKRYLIDDLAFLPLLWRELRRP
ncbi:MAG: WecB/TagA/CpsF family glycosyltransferase [Flavobacteriales bacterium]|nr:WecB/TagA/CpsF family glycosyltransferase [Flavobacteriales bacterium]